MVSPILFEMFCALCFASSGFSQTAAPLYSDFTNHVEIIDRAIELAESLGFKETAVSADTVRMRLECGVYEEDYAVIPGSIGEHFPFPWLQGPDFPFSQLLPVTKIPYGEVTDTLSGWYRGFSHGYDPHTGYRWPNSRGTPIEWANSPNNTFTWSNAIALYAKNRRSEAYECLGHVLHLLMDLSVPAHVKVVNHGAVLSKQNSGYPWDPDLVSITIDEYEMALNGGLESDFVSLIPDLHGVFMNALARARSSDIPTLRSYSDYFQGIAALAAGNSDVNKYYLAPDSQGTFGHYRSQDGGIVYPVQLGSIVGPGQIGDRYTQIAIYTTASTSGGTVVPQGTLAALCDSLVPRAVEFSAGLLYLFWQSVTTGVETPPQLPLTATLEQSYPNPFNPTTVIRFQLSAVSMVRLVVYDLFGQEVAILVNERRNAGVHEVRFNGSNLSSGVYFCRLQARDASSGSGREFVQTRRLSLIR